MYRRPPPPRRTPEPRQPTLSELALEQMKKNAEPEPPFGGWGGEFVVPRPPEPPPITWGPAFRPEPPDWDAEHREFVERERAEQARQDELRLERLARERQQQAPEGES